MDSFYDAPRRPPQPMSKEKFLSATPVVPEISVLCLSNITKNNFIPYNQWKKDAMAHNFLVGNKENINNHFQNTQNTSILKKQVRFESPVLLHSPVERDIPFSNKTNSNTLKNDSPRNDGRSAPSFEQIYMANIPNRQLDLSLIDIPKRIPEKNNKKITLEEKQQPKTYKEFLDCQKIDDVVINDSVTDIFNYKRNKKQHHVLNSTVMNTSNEMPRNPNKQYSPLPSSNASKIISNKSEFKQIQNKEREQLKQTDHHYTCLTEAIARRKEPMGFDNLQTQVVEQTKNDTPQMQWFTSQNIDKRLENKAFSEYTVPQENHSFQINNNQRQGENEPKANKYQDPNLLSANLNEPKSDAIDVLKKHECYTQTSNDLDTLENIALRPKCDNNISAKDLLKIIALQSQQMAQQNEQMLLLQKQVSELISRQSGSDCHKQKSIQCGKENKCCYPCQNYNESRHCCSKEQHGMRHYEQKQAFMPSLMSKNMENIQDRCITSTQHEHCDQKRKEGTPTKNKNQLQNFSIGLTTSFEVSFRRPPTNKNQNDHYQNDKQMQYFEQQESPKIQELTENNTVEDQKNCRQKDYREQKNVGFDNKETLIDASMVFKEPIRVRESCPSPEPSIKINMNDFEDSEDDDDMTSDIGPSFYRNLMVQVNKILQKAQIETGEEVPYNFKGHQQLKNETLHKVKEATFKHLKRIGVEVQNSEDSSQSNSFSDGIDCKSYNQDEISFAVKQLLMKYLPAAHLAKLAYTESPPRNKASPTEKIGTIKNRPDFSFATVQYMKKYNLIANNPRDPYNKAAKANQSESPKILDISKLKLQPKLL